MQGVWQDLWKQLTIEGTHEDTQRKEVCLYQPRLQAELPQPGQTEQPP